MTTFSQMVDALVAESRRSDMRDLIGTYINQSIRDVHFNAAGNKLIKLKDNLVEQELIADQDEAYVWPIPKPQLFAAVEAVFYRTPNRYASERSPSSMFNFETHILPALTWYRTGQSLAFSGYGGIGGAILLSWFQYPRRLTYMSTAVRPAQWSDITESYTYHVDYNSTPELQATARDLTTNWLLERWEDLIMEGARAKMYKRLADAARMSPAYSTFERARISMVAAETYESRVMIDR